MLKFNRVSEFHCTCECVYDGYAPSDMDNRTLRVLGCDCHNCRELTESFFQGNCNSSDGKYGWHFTKDDFFSGLEEWGNLPEYMETEPVLPGDCNTATEQMNSAEHSNHPCNFNVLKSGK